MKYIKYTILSLFCYMSLAACQKNPQPDPTPAAGGENCYIISDFKAPFVFRADVKGCSNEPLDKWDTAEVLWESKGTEEATAIGEIITITPDVNSQVIQVNARKNGNAVVAVKKGGRILWSWHIWACEGYDPVATAQKYNNNAGIVMDRNLGATSATPGQAQAMGLLFQWGRKDPFLGGGKCTNTATVDNSVQYTRASSTLKSWPAPVKSDAQTGTIQYAIEHPTTFITHNEFNDDWYYTGEVTTDHTRWSDTAKSMYDPCPKGWMMMKGNTDGVFANAFNIHEFYEYIFNNEKDVQNGGYDFGASAAVSLSQAQSTWYPCSGLIDYINASLNQVGGDGYYWTASIFSGGNEALSWCHAGFMWEALSIMTCSGAAHAFGCSVRCVKATVQ